MLTGKRTTDDNENKSLYFRSDRVSLINNRYYFSTREGTMEGPYRTREEALFEIEAYIRRMTTKVTGVSRSTSSLSFNLSLAER